MDIHVAEPGVLACNGRQYRCALGSAGIGEKTREGDGLTPIGCFALRRVHYRADRLAAPATNLPVRAIGRADGWCDDPGDGDYNQLVRLPHAAGHEQLWRSDGLYDLVVEVGYNDDPVVAGRGSAIFLHIVRPGYGETEGCVALAFGDLLQVLKDCDPETRLCIEAGPSA
jgi:L,D-peptidoglycan transpeptidase YkuD (ErfK/YbiS/YcfS/YnhG family)